MRPIYTRFCVQLEYAIALEALKVISRQLSVKDKSEKRTKKKQRGKEIEPRSHEGHEEGGVKIAIAVDY